MRFEEVEEKRKRKKERREHWEEEEEEGSKGQFHSTEGRGREGSTFVSCGPRPKPVTDRPKREGGSEAKEGVKKLAEGGKEWHIDRQTHTRDRTEDKGITDKASHFLIFLKDYC